MGLVECRKTRTFKSKCLSIPILIFCMLLLCQFHINHLESQLDTCFVYCIYNYFLLLFLWALQSTETPNQIVNPSHGCNGQTALSKTKWCLFWQFVVFSWDSSVYIIYLWNPATYSFLRSVSCFGSILNHLDILAQSSFQFESSPGSKCCVKMLPQTSVTSLLTISFTTCAFQCPSL